MRAKIISGVVFGVLLAGVAVWVGLQSLGGLAMPQASFAMLAEVPRRPESSESIVVKTVSKKAKKKATTIVPDKPVLPPPAFTAAVLPAVAPVSIPVAEPPIAPPPMPSPASPVAVMVPPPVAAQAAPLVVPVPPPPPAPQAANSTHPFLSEVFVGSEQSGEDEFVELYNPSSLAIDLTRYAIKKKTGGGSESTLVSAARLIGKSIPSHSYFLIVHDGGQGSGDASWAKSNTLAAKNNAIALYASGQLIDQVSWSEIPKGSSYARLPLMEGGVFSIQNIPTPRQ